MTNHYTEKNMVVFLHDKPYIFCPFELLKNFKRKIIMTCFKESFRAYLIMLKYFILMKCLHPDIKFSKKKMKRFFYQWKSCLIFFSRPLYKDDTLIFTYQTTSQRIKTTTKLSIPIKLKETCQVPMHYRSYKNALHNME